MVAVWGPSKRKKQICRFVNGVHLKKSVNCSVAGSQRVGGEEVAEEKAGQVIRALISFQTSATWLRILILSLNCLGTTQVF